MTTAADRRITMPVGNTVKLVAAPGGVLVQWWRDDDGMLLWQGVAASPNHASAVVKELLRLKDPFSLPGSSSAGLSAGGTAQEISS